MTTDLPDTARTTDPVPPSADADPRPFLSAALDQVEALLVDLRPDHATLPTPCDKYDVAHLVGHLQAVVRRIGVVLSGQPFWSSPREVESIDWLGEWREGRSATEAVLEDDAVLTREVSVPWGTVTGTAAIGSYVGELTVHAWDLARAIGQSERLDPALAEGVLPAYQAMIPAEPRGEDIPFGPIVHFAKDAGPYERLVAWTGRDPHWSE